jgi:AcrR family transcriptional regulator
MASFPILDPGANPSVAPSTVSARPRLSSSERREAIIEAALSLFAEKGFRGVTTRELASAVGVSEPVLYQHFKTKSDLFRALVETQCVLQETALELKPFIDAGDDTGFFRALGRGILDWYLDDPRFAKLLLHSSLDRHELSDLFYETHVSRFYQIIEEYLAARMAQGVFRAGDPPMLARAFVGMFVHFGMIHAVYKPDRELGDRAALVNQLTQVFLSGCKQGE